MAASIWPRPVQNTALILVAAAILQILAAWLCQANLARVFSNTVSAPVRNRVVVGPDGALMAHSGKAFGATLIYARVMRAFAQSPELERRAWRDQAPHLLQATDASNDRSSFVGMSYLPDWGYFSSSNPELFAFGAERRSSPRGQVGVGWPWRSLHYIMIDLYAPPTKIVGGYALPLKLADRLNVRPHLAVLPYRPIAPGFIANTAIYSVVLLIGSRLIRLRSILRLRRNRCPACGYSLAGQASPGCPECGWKRIDRIGDAAQ